jgi:hypothetical protein
MRRFLAGVITGVILGFVLIGSTPSARADVGSFFMSVTKLYGENANFQRGYVAGVYDAVQVLAPIAGRGSVLYNIADCLDRQGDTISQFEIYAGNALHRSSSVDIAAADPIMSACVRR